MQKKGTIGISEQEGALVVWVERKECDGDLSRAECTREPLDVTEM